MRSKLFGTRKRRVMTLASFLTLAVCGVALAAWLVSGSATFGGQAATLSAPTVTATTGTNSAYPGDTAEGSLDANVVNPNPVDLHITAVDTSGATITSSDPTNCPSSWFELNGGISAALVGTGVPANGSTTIEADNAYELGDHAPTGCQGVSITVSGVTLDWSTNG